MKYLITGGAGFIGSNYIHYLLEKEPEAEIVNLDKLTYAGNLENLREIEEKENYTFIKGDICNKDDTAKAMQGCDAVVNFAAESHVDRSIEDNDDFLRTNFLGVKTLCEEAKKNDVKKFVMISTDEVYGSIENGSFTENDKLHPRNPYSAAKAAGELLAMSYFETFGLPVVVTRSSNNFGPYQYPEKIIPLFITNILREKKVPLYGDGLNVRDWLYVKDNCSGIQLALEKGKPGEIYNIGGGNEVTNLELTKMILGELGKGEEMIEKVKDRIGHDRRYSIDSSKAGALGWKPEASFEKELKETIKWYRENTEWWQRLLK